MGGGICKRDGENPERGMKGGTEKGVRRGGRNAMKEGRSSERHERGSANNSLTNLANQLSAIGVWGSASHGSCIGVTESAP